MSEIAIKISKPFEFCRVDLYNINGKIYFGEITFVPNSGRTLIKPIEYDYKLGELWK